MAVYTLRVEWARKEDNFLDQKYSRRHTWKFDGEVTVPASSSPQVVPIPYSDESAVDPEEAFVASVSSCHMLWFLSIAARRGYLVDSYTDKPVGVMEKNAEGKMAITRIEIVPKIEFSGENRPDEILVSEMHREAHESCFIANSVKTDIRVKGLAENS